MKLEPVDLREIDKRAANIYEAINACAKKSRIINEERKIEFANEISNILGSSLDDEGEDFNNPDQLKISLKFEKRPKPHIEALNLLLNGKLNYRYKSKTL
ncbi:MAG: hypothetical protein STSR0008_19320 [Ignavibacterium sp.]